MQDSVRGKLPKNGVNICHNLDKPHLRCPYEFEERKRILTR